MSPLSTPHVQHENPRNWEQNAIVLFYLVLFSIKLWFLGFFHHTETAQQHCENSMDDVRATSAWVASHSSHVVVDSSGSFFVRLMLFIILYFSHIQMRCVYALWLCGFSGIEKVVSTIDSIPKVEWDFEGIHYFDNGPLTVQYLFVLDALNFCFWPGTYVVIF